MDSFREFAVLIIKIHVRNISNCHFEKKYTYTQLIIQRTHFDKIINICSKILIFNASLYIHTCIYIDYF